MGERSLAFRLPLTSVAVALGACLSSPTSDDPFGTTEQTLLLSIRPAAGAVDVSITTDIEISFDHSIPEMMRSYVALHDGDCPGPVVAGVWSGTSDHMGLHFMPTEPLVPGTEYTVHIGGGMTDSFGMPVDLEFFGVPMGGEWATEGMVLGPDGMGMDMMGQPILDHAGMGWAGTNGNYGLVFSFTTAG